MEKRRVTVSIGGLPCSFYTDDTDEYISALEQRTNEALRQAAGVSGSSAYRNAVLAVLSLTDQLMRTEQKGETEHKGNRKSIPKAAVKKEKGQVSVWDLLDAR